MAANGVGVPTKILLSGTGITNIKGPVYQVTLSLTGTSTVAVTAACKDIAGSDPSYAGSVTWSSDNAAYASVSGGTVTAHVVGQAIIEAAVPSFDVNGANDVNSGKVYAQLIVTVHP